MISVLSVFLAKLVSVAGVVSMGLGTLFYTSAIFKGSKNVLAKQFMGLFLADVILGLHGTMLYTYVGFALVSLMGMASVRFNATGKVVMSLASLFVFYLITNVGFALVNGLQIEQALIAGIPFIKDQLVGMIVASVAYSLYVYKTKNTVVEVPVGSLVY